MSIGDFYHSERLITGYEDLFDLYLTFEDQRLDKWSKTMGKKFTVKDSFYEWLNKRKICPIGLITRQSIYWLELISFMDGEFGLNLPLPYKELPDIFFQALSVVRAERARIRQEDERGRQINSNRNKGTGAKSG